MPKKKWATLEQEAWLQERLSDFLHAQQQKTTTTFFPPIYEAWYKMYPRPAPTAEEIEEAGAMAKAQAVIKKKEREVSI
jgi:hypothetical protein